MTLEEDYVIEKRNILNELRSNNLTLQELRFFSIYMAKINARDLTTRSVRFSLQDYQRIMELGKPNLSYIKDTIADLLCKVVTIPLETGGVKLFQLFKVGVFTQNEEGEWYIEIDAHDDMLPLIFQFKEKYFTYELWNALRLKSTNQLRMYEILKQYEYAGERIISIRSLKDLLGIDAKDYPRYTDFKMHVLEVCQKALEEYTDLKYEFEPAGKKGKGGKVLNIKFRISKNENYKDQLSLSEFIAQQDINSDEDEQDSEQEDSNLSFLTDACENEFSQAEIQILYNLAIKIIPYKAGQSNQLEIYNYLKRKYDELNWRASTSKIKKRFGYLKKLIEIDLSTE